MFINISLIKDIKAICLKHSTSVHRVASTTKIANITRITDLRHILQIIQTHYRNEAFLPFAFGCSCNGKV